MCIRDSTSTVLEYQCRSTTATVMYHKYYSVTTTALCCDTTALQHSYYSIAVHPLRATVEYQSRCTVALLLQCLYNN
eukprot:8211826-Pyramimonas_sp.AAC.1